MASTKPKPLHWDSYASRKSSQCGARFSVHRGFSRVSNFYIFQAHHSRPSAPVVQPHASEGVKKSSALRASTIAYSPVPQGRGFKFLKQFCFNHLRYLNPHPCGMGLWALFTISAEIRFFHTFLRMGPVERSEPEKCGSLALTKVSDTCDDPAGAGVG